MDDFNTASDHIEELRKKLYSRNREDIIRRKKRSFLRPSAYKVAEEWQPNFLSKSRMGKTASKLSFKTSFFKKFFIFAIVFFIAALIFTFFVFYGGSNIVSTENVEILVLGNSFAAGGEPINLQVEIVNYNNISLEFSDLLIEYPKGSAGGDLERIRKSLGTIEANNTASENFNLVLFGSQGSVKEIKVTLEYRIKNSNAIFVKEENYPITISSSPISLSVDAPQEASSNQEITLNIASLLNSLEIVKDISLKVEYPTGFRFRESNPAPTLRDNIWSLGDLNPGSKKSVSIKGEIFGQDGEERSFRIFSGVGDSKDPSEMEIIYDSFLHTVVIRRPFIAAKILIDGVDSEEYAVASQTAIKARIDWTNNLSTKVDNVEISARFSGNALNKNSVRTLNGFYDSSENNIIWNKSTSAVFDSLEPGQTGWIDFDFSSLPLFSETGSLMENPQITIEVSIKGKQPTGGNDYTEVNNFEKKTIKINSDFQVVAEALHFSGPFTNGGPVPPAAGEKTTYTIIWSVSNSANRVSGAEVRASLPIYVNWLGKVSPASENVSYDAPTRGITWLPGQIERGIGLSSPDREIAFQVELLPSVSQIGSIPQLLSETEFSGRDSFTGALLKAKRGSINTRLSNDPGFTSGDEKVVASE